jgi:hypothetical protein
MPLRWHIGLNMKQILVGSFITVVVCAWVAFWAAALAYGDKRAATQAVDEPKVAPTAQAVTLPFGDVPDVLPDIASQFAFVETPIAAGSAVLVRTHDANGKVVLLAWTCSHVINQHLAEGNSAKKSGLFSSVPPPSKLFYITVTIGSKTYPAHVVACGDDSTGGVDVAVLMVDNPPSDTGSAEFTAEVPTTGSKVYHLGAAFAQHDPPNFLTGMVSSVGRKIDGSISDEFEMSVAPGCSGGGVYTIRGKVEGLMEFHLSDGICADVPARVIIEWARRNGVEWALDNHLPVPAAFSVVN